MLKYEQIAKGIRQSINSGGYSTGDRLPGVRTYAKQLKTSVSTIISAYHLLEREGWLRAIPKSGFYVDTKSLINVPLPSNKEKLTYPIAVTRQELTLQLVNAASEPNIINLGAAIPAPSFLPTKLIQKHLNKVAKEDIDKVVSYDKPVGVSLLRQQIAKRMVIQGCNLKSDDIVITNGCQEAIYLALKSCTKEGEIIAVESPTYYGLINILESLSLKAIEIPTDPVSGISVDALQLALEKWDIKACVVVSAFSNPLGACLTEQKKEQLIELSLRFDFVLIEDDVYGELSHEEHRPSLLKAKDNNDIVIYCSSFSKTMSAGLRVGWVASGRYASQIEYLKYVMNFSSSNHGQLAIAHILENGQYDRYLRQVRQKYAYASHKFISFLSDLLPDGTRMSKPEGGYVIWVELPSRIDMLEIANELLQENISIAPGIMFSVSDKFQHCFRLSSACEWNRKVEESLLIISSKLKAKLALKTTFEEEG